MSNQQRLRGSGNHEIRRDAATYHRILRIESLEPRRLLATIGNNLEIGEEVRNYRIAIAATAEYTAFSGGQSQALAAINQFVDGLNSIFEPELSVHFDLVSGASVIYTNASGDPYVNGDVSAMLAQNQANLDAIIGDANYDIGHVFGTTASGGAGVATLGVVGRTGWKAQGASVSSDPRGPRWLRQVAHEIGHQFNARHTFNADANGSCVNGRSAANAYEPGSGSTLMSYAGICGSDNLQANQDPYLHSASFDEIETYIRNTAAAAPYTTTANGNNIPTVEAGPEFTVPARTPFELTAVGSDADGGDILTFTWEELDLGTAQSLPLSDNGQSPLFRSFPPSTDPGRTFPRLDDLLNNVNTEAFGEALPTTTRDLNFRATVRDGNGGVSSDDVLLNVVDTGMAFAVTTPNTAVAWTGGSTQALSWNVAGTNGNGINTATVSILMSTDSGQTFPFELGTTPNDGSHVITVPNINTSQVRVKIQGDGNIFFDICDEDLTIDANPMLAGITLTPTDGSTRPMEGGALDNYEIALNTDPVGTVVISVTADSQTQISTDGINFASDQMLSFNSTASQTITVRAIDDSTLEGPHNSLITHAVTSSTSTAYPVGMLIDSIEAQVVDNELPPVVGVDLDYVDGQTARAPDNWTHYQIPSDFDPHTLSDLPGDDGTATPYDITFQYDLAGFNAGASTAGANSDSIPQHIPVLADIGGYNRSTIPITITWRDLTPGRNYGIYVFGLEVDGSRSFAQTVTITGTTSTSFVQTLSDSVLHVNDEVGTASRTLKSFEEVVAADANGKIIVRVAPNPGSDGFSLGGVAIRELFSDPPEVADIFIRGETWSVPAYSLLTDPRVDQPLPWINLNQIDVVFSENVQVTYGSLALVGVNAPTYVPDPARFFYDSGTFTATWKFAAPLPTDKLLLDIAGQALDSSPVVDLSGLYLNGGSDIEIRFDILQGDGNRDGATESGGVFLGDLVNLSSRYGEEVGDAGYSVDYDINGDGGIFLGDLVNLSSRYGTTLPDGVPEDPDPLPLLALGGQATDGSSLGSLAPDELTSVAGEAIRHFATMGLAAADLTRLGSVDLRVADPPSGQLGKASRTTLPFEFEAAGHGWSINTTPQDDLKFLQDRSPIEREARPDSEAAKRVDLLTVVMQEFERVRGYHHPPDHFDLMAASPIGTRHVPETIDTAFVKDLVDLCQFEQSHSTRIEKLFRFTE